MGYNIADVSGNSTGGPDVFTFTADLTDPTVDSVSGDFDVASIFGGGSLGEATDGYTFGPLSTTDYGTLSFNTTDGTFTFDIDEAAAKGSGSDQVVSFTITGTSGSDSDTDTVNINILICMNRGTLIETQTGAVPVEDLRLGDLVQTRDHGLQPIRWIGSRRISAAELITIPSLRPIRIARGALGEDTPSRDLLVSPQHRVLVSDWRAELLFGEEEVLVPAKGLINDTSIRIDHGTTDVEYFHVLFDAHEVIVSEGAYTESFHPGPYSLTELSEDAKAELLQLFPELGTDETAYGSIALPALRPWEARVLPIHDADPCAA